MLHIDLFTCMKQWKLNSVFPVIYVHRRRFKLSWMRESSSTDKMMSRWHHQNHRSDQGVQARNHPASYLLPLSRHPQGMIRFIPLASAAETEGGWAAMFPLHHLQTPDSTSMFSTALPVRTIVDTVILMERQVRQEAD